MIVGILSMTVGGVLVGRQTGPHADRRDRRATGRRRARRPEHVARLGGELFGRHLIAVEVAGMLLLAALVGAAVIVAQGKTAR